MCGSAALTDTKKSKPPHWTSTLVTKLDSSRNDLSNTFGPAQHLARVSKVTWEMPAEYEDDKLRNDVRVDSDRVKGTDRKSTSRGVMISGTVVKHWWRTRASPALSVAGVPCHLSRGQLKGWERNGHGRIWGEGQGQNMDRLHRGQSDSVEKGLGEHKGHRVEVRDMLGSVRVEIRRVRGGFHLADQQTKGKAGVA